MAPNDDIKTLDLPPSVKDRLGFLFAKHHLSLLRRVEAKIGTGGVTGRHYGCLTVIADEGPMTQQRLGQRMGVDRTTVVSVVDTLEKHGFVERRRKPDDRRAYALQITPKGEDWLERMTETILATEREYLAPLSAAERKQLVDMLQRVLASQPAELLAYPPVEVRSG